MNVFTANQTRPLILGRQGENDAVTIQFPIARWLEEFGSGSFALVHQRATDAAPYPVTVTADEECVYWTIASADTAVAGLGSAQLTMTVGTMVAKSEKFVTMTAESLGQTSDPPDPWQAWVDEVLEARDEVLERVPEAPDEDGTYTLSCTVSGGEKTYAWVGA